MKSKSSPNPFPSQGKRSRSLGAFGLGGSQDLFTSLVSPLFPSAMGHLPSLASALTGYSAAYPLLMNALRLFVLSVLLEAARRWLNDLVAAIKSGLAFTVYIPETDSAYQWVHHWLCAATTHDLDSINVPMWEDLLEAIFPTGRVSPRTVVMVTRNPWIPAQDVEDNPTNPLVKNPTLWTYPSTSLRRTILYHSHFIHIENTVHRGLLNRQDEVGTVSRSIGKDGTIKITTYSRSRKIVARLIRECRAAYMEKDRGRLTIHIPRPHLSRAIGTVHWIRQSNRAGRPWDSVILQPGIKEKLLKDAADFVTNVGRYKSRGLPYRRGYLLYGMPGTGKSSLIAAIASKLRLDVYTITLQGGKQMDGERLSELFGECPARSIVLIEDIDCAFGSEYEEEDLAVPLSGKKEEARQARIAKSRLTMSGILNAIDGVGSSEGRLLFCTTNHIDKIDPALIRPGRCDLQIEFRGATRSQARQLFVFVFSPREEDETTVDLSSADSSDPLSDADLDLDLDLGGADEKTHAQLTLSDIEDLARQFADKIPEERLPVAAIQSFLMRFGDAPRSVFDHVDEWLA